MYVDISYISMYYMYVIYITHSSVNNGRPPQITHNFQALTKAV